MHQMRSLCGISTAPKYMVARNASIRGVESYPNLSSGCPAFRPIIPNGLTPNKNV